MHTGPSGPLLIWLVHYLCVHHSSSIHIPPDFKGQLTFIDLSYTHGLWWLCTSALSKLSVNQPPDPATMLASWHWSLGVLCAPLEWPCWALPPSGPPVACHMSLMQHFHRFLHIKPCGAGPHHLPPARFCPGDLFRLSGPWASSSHPISDNFYHFS